ncbi:MAG: Glycerol-3-phosphate cytidylyltransferase [Candidatus Nomurabacteria bacterium GW2011_GWA1_43_17]|uniref:Glycerol-3-phosphate cytidylyltransferase n=1 Tax=Candidatus Nomurabacteria bacterium GW2011_GWF2_43_24 TaxID=1618778 RepID=A0A0G1EKU5_9BACT|nr:MAG: Glycerol-3-phosphate cytidylyltransferase [Parcubacteria group bacterium GW2011_GWC1_42_21]KKS58325.1 MAG: Glycerol-3-phosphate cytidylyltransferase [Candidatus Nomurabacteria bacterium GW2011_GWF1_42_40]KKS99603.1 MAG: Glycerol-3-phosphate cytidylyltransferase [Candidatus Nomurabacteria bacterium GW2011_GWA1_43_17]KKT10676.1 MAG: Glycerol-3-phosphate cytidylyltransferase [Candidatus Nomurabacteria bacterium GW2011_GWF2_43_24]
MIGFTCGAMDLLHAGHVLMLKECREQCDFLIVALQIDPSIDRPEKNKPIETAEERMIRLQGCRYVDKIVTYNTEVDLYNLLKKLNPDVRFMGIDWKDRPNYSRDLLQDMKVIYNSRDHNYSSSDLRQRIMFT